MLPDWRKKRYPDLLPRHKLYVYTQLENTPERALPATVEYFGYFLWHPQFIKAVIEHSPKEVSSDWVWSHMHISTDTEHYARAEGHPNLLFRRVR